MDDCEITLEMNPKTASQEALCAYYQAGFNRLSIGCQSANERELKMLGRLHNFADFQSTMEMARAAGFENISADLMMSLPDQTLDSLGHSIDSIVACRPTHISVYGLKIEGGTWFDRHKQELNLPNEEQESEQYLFTVEKLREHGYLQYEISNFALVGYPSRHNLKYWHGQPYLGFGPAAYSYFENRRYGYSRSLADYIEATMTMDFSRVLQDEETLGEDERLQEKLLLGLRLNEGVRLSQYPFSEKAISRIMEFVSQGLCQLQDGNLSLTPTGMLLDNYITSDLLLYL